MSCAPFANYIETDISSNNSMVYHLAAKFPCNKTQYVLYITLYVYWDIEIQEAGPRESVTSVHSEMWRIFLSVIIFFYHF